MDETVNNGVPKKSQRFRILVLLPEGDGNIGDAQKRWENRFHAKYKDEDFNPQVDFFTVKKPDTTKAEQLEIGESVVGEYDLGIAYGDWLYDWINNNPDLTPQKKRPGDENSSEDAKPKLPFILITTKPEVKEPHLKAYPGEGLVGMLLARLMDKAADRAKRKKLLGENYKWRAFFYRDKSAQGSNACLEAFEENAKDFDQDAEKKVITFYQDAKTKVVSFCLDREDISFWQDGKSIRFDSNQAAQKFKKEFSGVELFCAYAASAPDATAYDTIVRAINSLGSENDKKILVTDACWDVPKECTNLRIAQLCGTQSQTENGELLVGSKLFCWLIPTLLELVLKTLKYVAAKSEQKQSITELITKIGPLMSVQGTTFSFVGQEMFIPFSFSYYSWVALNGGGAAEYDLMVEDVCPVKEEDVRPEEEAREAVAVAMSCIEKAANDFRKGITGKKSKIREEATTKRAAKKDHEAETGEISHVAAAEDDSKKEKTNSEPMSVDDATTEFGKKFEADVLIACFAAQKVFFVDDKHKGLSQDRWKFPVAMPKNCVGEVAENSRVIQVAYNRRNIENTEAVQLYLVHERPGGKVDDEKVVPVADLLLKRGSSIPSKAKIICSRSKQRADQKLLDDRPYRYDFDKDGIVVGLRAANANQYNYLYYVPTYNWDGSGNMPAVAFFSDVKFCDFELSALQIVVTRFFSVLYTEDRVRKVKISAVRAAIGAIMSRNGSHNIGSHVLASLSHNVGTMPDDRVLYQYIQHRMDYIATATTEAPRWAQPTMFVANMMKEFLRQKHLLDHISGSEGLHAYKFQGHSAGGEQENTIRVHVRRINPTELGLEDDEWETRGLVGEGQVGVTEFIHYSDAKNGEAGVGISQDIAVAIPGGVIGQHAFYTILENVLRNAAKHEWSQMVKIAKRGHLNLYVDFVDRPEKGSVVCRVWTKCVLMNDEEQSDVDQAEQSQSEDEDNSLLEKMSNKIGSSFVNAAGELKKENWGIAEMRISAGYLQGSDIAEVAGLKSSDSALKIIRPRLVNTGDGRNCLGYRFELKKPKELLVVLSDETVHKKIDELFKLGEANVTSGQANVITIRKEAETNLAKAYKEAPQESTVYGGAAFPPETYASSKQKLDFDKAIDAGFVNAKDKTTDNFVLPSGEKNAKGAEPTPSKATTSSKSGIGLSNADALQDKINVVLSKANAKALQYGVEFKAASQVKKADTNAYSYVLFEDPKLAEKLLTCVPFRTLTGEDLPRENGHKGDSFTSGGLVGMVMKIAEPNEDARKTCFQLLEDVYAGWLKHISEVRYGKGAKHPLRLALDIEGEANSSGGRQSLVSDFDLLRFVFEHSFNAATRSFCIDKRFDVPGDCRKLLEAVTEMKSRTVASLKELVAFCCDKPVESVINEELDEARKKWIVEDIVDNQLGVWFAQVLPCVKECKANSIDEFYAFPENDKTIQEFIDYISSTILKQADAFLRKYEEDISTLPVGFSDSKTSGNSGCHLWTWGGGLEVDFVTEQTDKDALEGKAFCYFRHGDSKFCGFTPTYYEAVSGSQSELNALVAFKDDVQVVANKRASSKQVQDAVQNRAVRFAVKLAENAIVRVLIIDERVKKFMDEHENVKQALPGLGIAVLDHNSPETKMLFPEDDDGWKAVETLKVEGMPLKGFEIVIIHQGVIDKGLGNAHEDKEKVGVWLEKVKSQLRYVIITTGRGSPANIPDSALVLPYSVIESSILQRYPEKLILVDTVMNILPARKGR